MSREIQSITTREFIIQSIMIHADVKSAYRFIADPKNLPLWTNAFKEADESKALLNTPTGAIDIGLKTLRNENEGTIDWYMEMPDGTVGVAYSRIVPVKDRCIYSFILLPPPLPLEEIEGKLEEQGEILRHELINLSELLKDRQNVS
jgi:hypothetical protein